MAVGSDEPDLASVDFSDLILEDTLGDAFGEFGRGLEVAYGADARFSRLWIRNSRIHALFVDGAGSTLTATDAFALETQPKASDGTSGFGALATNGAIQNGVFLYPMRVESAGQVEASICNFSGTSMTPITDLPVRILTFG